MMGFNRRTPWQCKTAALARLWRQKGVNVLVTSDIRPPYRYLSGRRWGPVWRGVARPQAQAPPERYRYGGRMSLVIRHVDAKAEPMRQYCTATVCGD